MKSNIRTQFLAALILSTPVLCWSADVAHGALGKAEAAFAAAPNSHEGIAQLADLAARNNPYASFYLGVAHELGRGVEKNPSLALEYYRSVADRVKEAAFNAGRLIYLSGNVADAVPFFVVAAGGEKADGIDRAMVLLGRIYETGADIGARNYVAAARWYEAAAKRKDPLAVAKIGEFLLRGLGRSVNTRDARIYLERAADMWNPDAQFLLGEMFAQGLGMQVNRTEAAKWFLVASSASKDHQKRSRAYLAGLTSLESGSAQRMAELWESAHSKPAPIDYLSLIERIR